IAVGDHLALATSRQVQIARERVARVASDTVVVTIPRVAVALVSRVAAAARNVPEVLISERPGARTSPDVDPVALAISGIVISVAWINIIEHDRTRSAASPHRPEAAAAHA